MDLNRDVLTSLTGGVLALAAGLWLGGMMRPELGVGGSGGPRLMTREGGSRTYDTAAPDGSLASYRGPLPDYVLGTDVNRADEDLTAVGNVEPPRDEQPLSGDAPQRSVVLVRPRTPQFRPPLNHYPSLHGGEPFEYDLAPPPAPVADEAPVAG